MSAGLTNGQRKREMGTGTGSSFRGTGACPPTGLPRRRTASSTQAFTAAADAAQPLR